MHYRPLKTATVMWLTEPILSTDEVCCVVVALSMAEERVARIFVIPGECLCATGCQLLLRQKQRETRRGSGTRPEACNNMPSTSACCRHGCPVTTCGTLWATQTGAKTSHDGELRLEIDSNFGVGHNIGQTACPDKPPKLRTCVFHTRTSFTSGIRRPSSLLEQTTSIPLLCRSHSCILYDRLSSVGML